MSKSVWVVWCYDDGILTVCATEELAEWFRDWYDHRGMYYKEDVMITEQEVRFDAI